MAVGDVEFDDFGHFLRVGEEHKETVGDLHLAKFDNNFLKFAFFDDHAKFLILDDVIGMEDEMKFARDFEFTEELKNESIFLW